MRPSFSRTVSTALTMEASLVKSNENGYTPRESIASTKVPGVKVKEDIKNESVFYNIDNEYDKILSMIEGINNEEDILICEDVLDKYYNKYKNKTYSDVRLYERVKNNHSNLVNLLENKINKNDNV